MVYRRHFDCRYGTAISLVLLVYLRHHDCRYDNVVSQILLVGDIYVEYFTTFKIIHKLTICLCND